MFALKKMFYCLSAVILLAFASLSFAEPIQGTVSLDRFFRYDIDIKKLTFDKEGRVLNLMAQMQDPSATTDNVNDFDQFFALGNVYVVPKGYDSVIREFDKYQKMAKPEFNGLPWLGVLPFAKEDIPKVMFQDGLNKVKQCMKEQGVTLPDKIARFIIFKANVPPQNFVYDYVFRDESAPVNKCQEVLYMPEQGTCNFGMAVNCHFEMETLKNNPAKSVK